MGHFVYPMFLFLLQKKSIIFKRTKISHYFTLSGKKNLIYLSEVTQAFCGLLPLLSKYFRAKIKYNGASLTVVSFAAVVWSRHTTPSIPRWRESAWRDETK